MRIPDFINLTDFISRWYIYDGWRVVEERSLSDFSLQKTFIYASYLDEVISLEARYEPAPGTPVNGYGFPEGTDAQISDGFYHATPAKTNTLLKRYYYHTNAIYSVMCLSNNAGELAKVYHYDAYGRAAVGTSKGADDKFLTVDDVVGLQSAVGNTYSFTGQRLDASGLMYYKNRYYHTEMGRFCSRDPLLGFMGAREVLISNVIFASFFQNSTNLSSNSIEAYQNLISTTALQV